MESPEPEQKRKPKIRENLFGPYEPPHSIGFPAHANITAYELVTFLPNSLRSTDVVYRFASNGATRSAIWSMVNTARDLQKEWRIELCGLAVNKTMEDAGYDGWTMKLHDRWKNALTVIWDERQLNVDNFRTFAELHGGDRPKEATPFKNLALFVRSMLQGNDALDMTRMVQYCVDNLAEEWMYLRDFEKLLKHVGGPRAISYAHFDRSSFARWDTRVPPPHRTWSIEEKQAAKDLSRSKRTKTKRKVDSSTLTTSMSEVKARDPTPGIVARVKTRARPEKRVTRNMNDLGAENAEEGQRAVAFGEKRSEAYKRAVAQYVAPPEHVAAPTLTDVYFAFRAEHEVGETEPFSAYAFGGPRHQAPFRMLRDVQEPHRADISGWAENLRWALEQETYFGYAMVNRGWNESPMHMQWIAFIRQEQVWASDELLKKVNENEDKKCGGKGRKGKGEKGKGGKGKDRKDEARKNKGRKNTGRKNKGRQNKGHRDKEHKDKEHEKKGRSRPRRRSKLRATD
ncbi:hypothetical protein DE146DRAFT_200005 [Phaeosphaeria sp. MPI-PUGE-AT-0046c]|nr:hypothetical protein DE146DRAFT_200005 [Phaeosphaeria sp. MPI-PUGE-AT-0046c]